MTAQPQPAHTEKFAEALAAIDQADFATAIERLSELVTETPEHAEAWMYLGVCYLETGQGPRALEALERAARAAPGEAPAAAQIHYLLGVAHGASGALDRALESFHHALSIDPSHQKAEEFRARTEGLIESRQHYKAALMLLREKSQPNYAAIALRELLLSTSGFPNSPARDELAYCFREVQKNLRETPCEVDSSYSFPPFFDACERGYQAVRLLNWPAAREAYEEAVALREEPFVFHGLALAALGSGDVENALRFWKHVLEREPEFDLGTLARVRPPGRVQ